MENKDNKEFVILQAAEDEFLEKGYDGAKTMSIARRAGVNHALLHYYFRTKQNLFEMVVKRKIETLAQSVIDSFGGQDSDMPLIDRILMGFEMHYDFLCENPKLPLFLVTQIFGKPENVQMFGNFIKTMGFPVMRSLDLELKQGFEAGVFKPIRAIDLFVDAISLNVFPFVAGSVVDVVREDMLHEDKATFLANRKKEIRKTIRARLLVNDTES